MKPLTRITSLLPRRAAMLVALVGVGLAFGYAFSAETPIGTVRGQAVLADTRRPLSGVRITLTPQEVEGVAVGMREAVTDSAGRFRLTQVPAGSYQASAYSNRHSVREAYLTVDEGGTTDVTLTLDRSEADLELGQHQRIFASAEKVYLPVRGYVNGSKPVGGDTLRVRLYRTRLSAVLRDEKAARALDSVGARYAETPLTRLPPDLLGPASGPAPQPLSTRDVPITSADREGFFHQRVQFGTPGPGLYLVDIFHEKHSVCAWMLVTDTALVVKRAGKQLLAYATDMTTGAPFPGCAVRTYRGATLLAQGVTGREGLAELTVPKQANETRLMTVAERGADEAVLGFNLWEEESEGRYTVQAYTDRPIYRPGQRLYYKGIARRNVEKGVRYAVPTGEAVTVELRDPNGERLLREQKTCSAYGSFAGHADLSPESPTGVYTLIMKVRGETHTHGITIASYKKPEFTVTVTPGKERYSVGEPLEATIEARYYFDAPVAGARVHYEAYRHADWAAEYPEEYGYDEEEEDSPRYRDYDEGSYGETTAGGDVTLDENGRAVIKLPAAAPGPPDAPQAHIYDIHIRAADSAGREAEADGAIQVTAGDYHLTLNPEGYVAEPGKPTQVTVSVKDYDGKPILNQAVTVETGYERWDQKEERSIFTAAGPPQQVMTGPDGKAVVALTPAHTGEMRLNAQTADAKGRVIRARAYLWAAGDGGGDLQTTYADLSLLADKRRYAPGETARIMLNAQRTGQTVLLTVEGDRVYRAFTVPMTKRSLILRLPVPESYGPNVTLAACYVRDKHFAQSETPLRVTLARREVRVSVRADRETAKESKVESRESRVAEGATQRPASLPRYQPGEAITYTVQTTDGQGRPVPCELSFGVVDESIYALKEDDPHALRDAFYPHRYNSVQTHYSFAVEYLGDADKAEPKIVARKRFPDTAYWNPALKTDVQGRAVVRFALPDNLTTWRATAVAQTLQTALGRETDKVVVSKDFFVRVEKPRFLTQNDEARLLALVHNETGARQTALVRLRVEGLAARGEMTQTLTLEPGQVGQAAWPVTAGPMGLAKIDVAAWTPRQAGARQYTDRMETTLPIRPHGRELEPVRYAGELTTGMEPEVVRLDPAAIPGASRLTIRITPSVAGSLGAALDYLIGYPYGCTEQTMSRFLPDVLAHRVQRLTGTRVLSAAQTADLPKMVRDSLARLYRFQHAKGGWGWWEQDPDDAWMTAYVLYGLAAAKAEGYPVSGNALARGRKAAATMLATLQDDDNRAFLLYALALAGDKNTPRHAMRRLRLGALSPQSLAYVVLLDRLLGGTGREAMDLLDRKARPEGDRLYWPAATSGYRDWNDRMTTASVLQAMLAVNRRDPRIPPALRWLMARRTGDYWESTRDTAWVVAALCDYLESRPAEAAPGGQVRILLNDRPVQTYALTPDAAREPELVLRLPSTALRPGKNNLLFERAGGSSTVFYSVELRQLTAQEDIPALTDSKIIVKREYLRVLPKKVGEDSWSLQTEATGNRLRRGDRVRVRLTLTVPRDMDYVLIEDPFPAGCETTERGSAEEMESWDFWYSSVDIRDDRIAFFARTITKGTHTIEYNLRAQTPGAYHTLPALLQGMYTPALRGESAEARVEVR